MITTSHMGLTVWDDAEDDFDHSQLADNFLAIDNHDHTSGKGKPLPAEAIAAGAITGVALAEEAVGPTKIQKNSIGSAQMEGDFLPLGTVIMWYRLNSGTSLPGGGWEILDGREWKVVTNSLGYSTGNMPNMIGKFAKGAAASGGGGTQIGDSGGASTVNLAHSHVVSSHTHGVAAHSHSVPAHTHGIFPDGEHAHQFRGNSPVEGGYNLFQGRVGVGHPGSEESIEVLKLDNITKSALEREIPVLPVGAHSHSGSTGATGLTTGGTGLTTESSSPSTDAKLGSTSIEPPYVGLLFLIKCR